MTSLWYFFSWALLRRRLLYRHENELSLGVLKTTQQSERINNMRMKGEMNENEMEKGSRRGVRRARKKFPCQSSWRWHCHTSELSTTLLKIYDILISSIPLRRHPPHTSSKIWSVKIRISVKVPRFRYISNFHRHQLNNKQVSGTKMFIFFGANQSLIGFEGGTKSKAISLARQPWLQQNSSNEMELKKFFVERSLTGREKLS